MWKVKGHCQTLCPGGFVTELLLYGQALARGDRRKQIGAGPLTVVQIQEGWPEPRTVGRTKPRAVPGLLESVVTATRGGKKKGKLRG